VLHRIHDCNGDVKFIDPSIEWVTKYRLPQSAKGFDLPVANMLIWTAEDAHKHLEMQHFWLEICLGQQLYLTFKALHLSIKSTSALQARQEHYSPHKSIFASRITAYSHRLQG